MSEGWTIEQAAEHDRWCRGKHLAGDPVWFPRRDECKRRGAKKVDGKWYCARHLRELLALGEGPAIKEEEPR